MSWSEEVEEIARRRARALKLGGKERIDRQHASGRLTVRERIDALIDPGSFFELGALAGYQTAEGFVPSGYVAGLGRVDGRDVAVGGEDFTVRGGSERDENEKVALICAMAKEYRIPLVLFHDGAGGNIELIPGSNNILGTSPFNLANKDATSGNILNGELTVDYQGELTDDKAPVTTDVTLIVTLFDGN